MFFFNNYVPMKRYFIIVVLLCLFGSLNAQTKTVVYGNLGVENANISVIGAQQGTVSDAKGSASVMTGLLRDTTAWRLMG